MLRIKFFLLKFISLLYHLLNMNHVSVIVRKFLFPVTAYFMERYNFALLTAVY